MTKDFAREYILDGGVEAVQGWLGDGAITATLAIHNWQISNNVQGDVAEIGIHHGKFFLVLKNLCRPGETAIAIDVFEDQHLNPDRSGSGNREVFENNIAIYSDGANIDIIKGDSKLLGPDRILAACKNSGVRLFSVDGSHTMEYTLSDLTLAAKSLADGGVIILDDFYSQYWPGVQEGLHHFMSAMGRQFSPIAIGENKLFICKSRDHSKILRFFRGGLLQFFSEYKDAGPWGADAVSMVLPGPREIFSENLSFARNVFSLCGEAVSPRCILQSGWSHREENGTWTIGERAVLSLQLIDPPRSGEVMLQLSLIPFLHDQRKSRNIDVFIDETLVGRRRLTNESDKRVVMPVNAAILHELITLSIVVECPERPDQFIASEDAREVGVKVDLISLG